MFDFYSFGKVYVFEDYDGFIVVESQTEIDNDFFVGFVIDSNIKEFEENIGSSIVFNKSMFDLVVSPKQLVY